MYSAINFDAAIDHCRSHYYREFAWKTVKGLDKPNKEGVLLDLRRNRTDPIRHEHHLIAKMISHASRPGKYISVYSFERLVKEGDKQSNGELYKEYLIGKAVNYESAKLNRIYFDFDNEDDPQKSINEALMVVRSLVKAGIYCHCYFSGSKGIALYIEFKTIEILPENKKEVLKLFLDSMIETVKAQFNHELVCIDYKVSFDLARVSRIPNTKHKSGLYCVPVSFGDMRRGLEYIKLMAQEPSKKNLELIITNCMRRNTKMQTILLNLEKQVICNRQQKAIAKEMKQNHLIKIKKFFKNAPNSVTDEQIAMARSTPLSSVIGNETRLRCPIHGGNNPTSLYIDHNKNFWYCHSCSAGGDGIKFMMLKENMSFKDAVLSLIK